MIFHLEFSVRKPNCSNCETFEKPRFDYISFLTSPFLFCPLLSNLFSMYADLGKKYND